MNNEDIRKQIERLRHVTCDTVDESKTLELLLAVKVAAESMEISAYYSPLRKSLKALEDA